jgi:hypothetical protein
MKIVKIIVLVLLVVFVGIQFVPATRNQSDVVPKTDFMLINDVPKEIKKKLKISCYDCHSNSTAYPWYSKIQPGAWFMESHIKNGKEKLNFNEWADYSDRRKKSKLKSIISQVRDDEMPLNSYTLIHKDAKFNENEKQKLMDWLSSLRDSL